MRSSASVSPPKSPHLVAGLRYEEAPLELVQDSKETLTVSAERYLLDRVSIGIPLVGLVSSPLRLKRLCRTQATRSPAEIVSSTEEESP